MTFVCHLKQASGGGYISMPKPTRKSFPVFSLPAEPTPAMVDAVRDYLRGICVVVGDGFSIEEMLRLALAAEKGELA